MKATADNYDNSGTIPIYVTYVVTFAATNDKDIYDDEFQELLSPHGHYMTLFREARRDIPRAMDGTNMISFKLAHFGFG